MNLEEDTWYLAGPMSGYPQYNIPLFDRVAAELRDLGLTVINPAERDSQGARKEALADMDGGEPDERGNRHLDGESWGSILARDVEIVAGEADGIIFLPGWEKSKGARLEAMTGLTQEGFRFRSYRDGFLCNLEKNYVAMELANALMASSHEPVRSATDLINEVYEVDEAARGPQLTWEVFGDGEYVMPFDLRTGEIGRLDGGVRFIENPKHVRAQKDGKAPLEYLVNSCDEAEAWVLASGAAKYGVRNWRVDKIMASTYEGSLRRHYNAWVDGEDIDRDSGQPHLAHIRANCAIIRDAQAHDTFIDDRGRQESEG